MFAVIPMFHKYKTTAATTQILDIFVFVPILSKIVLVSYIVAYIYDRNKPQLGGTFYDKQRSAKILYMIQYESLRGSESS